MSKVDPWEIRTLLAEALNAKLERHVAVDQVVSLILRPIPDASVEQRNALERFVHTSIDAVLRQDMDVYEAYRRILKCQMSADLGEEALWNFLTASANI